MNHPPVAVVVLHYGPLYVTLRCLKSLDAVRYPRLRIIVVDNSGAGEALRPSLRGFRHPVRLVAMRGNAGFTGGVNAGARAALAGGARWIWLLNNDATPAPRALHELVRDGESDTGIAAVGSKILDNRIPPRIWQAGATADLSDGMTVSRATGEPDRGQYAVAEDVDWVTGCSLMLRAEATRDLGLLDERFVMYYEETDWCLRARAAGWRVRYAPRSVVVHHVAGREAHRDDGWLYWETRNRLLLLANHRPASIPRALAGMLAWPVGSALRRGMLRGALAALRGIGAFLATPGGGPARSARRTGPRPVPAR